MNPWAIAIGAALGAVRAQGEEKAAHAERKVESTKSRWATFTGNHGKNVPRVDHMGRIMQGAMAGAAIGQQLPGGEAAPAGPAPTGNVAQTAAPMNQPSQMPAQPGQLPGTQPNMWAPQQMMA